MTNENEIIILSSYCIMCLLSIVIGIFPMHTLNIKGYSGYEREKRVRKGEKKYDDYCVYAVCVNKKSCRKYKNILE